MQALRFGWIVFAACALVVHCVGDDSGVPGSDAGPDVTISEAGTDVAQETGCGAQQTMCGTTCVSLASDPNNCGACGKQCVGSDGGATSCVSGRCGDAIVDVGLGNRHTCVVLADGEVWCWGDNSSGELGIPRSTPSSASPVKASLDGAIHVAAGPDWTCASKADHTVWCWGANPEGVLGHAAGAGSPPDETTNCAAGDCNATPQKVAGLPDSDLVFLTYQSSCARTLTGQLECWGGRICGNFGDGTGTTGPNTLPTPVSNVSGVAKVQDTSGFLTECSVDDGGTATCWGANTHGQAGHAPETTPPTCFFGGSVAPPVAVSGIASVTSISANPSQNAFTCATTSSGQAYCWGWDAEGTVHPPTVDTTTTNVNATPVPIALGTSAKALKVVTSQETACVLLDDGTVRCWGFNRHAEFGDGFFSVDGGASVPTASNVTNAVDVFSGANMFGALLKDGSLALWGLNSSGELGHMPGTGNDVPCNGSQCNASPSIVSGLP